MSVTLSCAGWWCGGGGGWRGLTGLTVGKHGYRWRLAAAGGAQGAHPEQRSHSCLGGAQEAGAQEVVAITCSNPAQYYHNPTTLH